MSELDLSTDQARVSYGIGRQLGDQNDQVDDWQHG